MDVLPSCRLPRASNRRVIKTQEVQPVTTTLRLRLTQDIAVREGVNDPSRNLKMVAEDLDTGEKGFWTMVFDTGFEVSTLEDGLTLSFLQRF